MAHLELEGVKVLCRSNHGVEHVLVAHDCDSYEAAQMMMYSVAVPVGPWLPHPLRVVRTSPDVAHMLAGCDRAEHVSAVDRGFYLVCDPSLEPGSVVR